LCIRSVDKHTERRGIAESREDKSMALNVRKNGDRNERLEKDSKEDKEKEMKKLEFGNKMEDTWIVEAGVLERRNHKTVANA
jgi:hypothetical protein